MERKPQIKTRILTGILTAIAGGLAIFSVYLVWVLNSYGIDAKVTYPLGVGLFIVGAALAFLLNTERLKGPAGK